MTEYKYQVGGSLAGTAYSYVERQADTELYHGAKNNEFCYVLNSRQMGKSSLLVRTRHRLEQEGVLCATLDMTNIGSENITVTQWYKGIITDLCSAFDLFDYLKLKTWWQTQEDLSLPQRLSNFISELLQKYPHRKILIFIDEIDSIKSLDFSVDDFFVLIRNCYNQRAVNLEYCRLTFVIAGVATPSDLITDTTRTPFNIGKAIHLQGFQFYEASILLQGLSLELGDTRAVLKAIFAWTDGQPFLTQKLLQMVADTKAIPPGTEKFWVDNLVYSCILRAWESQDNPEHLRTIRNRLLNNPQYTPSMLALYQKMLQGVEVPTDDTRVQTELLLSGLVMQYSGFLKVKNLIYEQVFNLDWVERQLASLRPYSQSYNAWCASKQLDESRLLRGQALTDALLWAQGKSLSDGDYQFLDQSQNLNWRLKQLTLKAERTQAIAAQLLQQKKYTQQQNVLIIVLIAALTSVTWLSAIIYFHGRTIAFNQINTITTSSELLFTSNRHLDAMFTAISAKRQLLALGGDNRAITSKVDYALQQAVLGASESNRLIGHQGAVKGVAFSPNGKIIASASGDKTVKLWNPNGQLSKTLIGHKSLVWDVAFSKDSNTIVSGSMDGTVKLWRPNGKLIKTLIAHPGGVLSVSVSKNLIISAGIDKTIKLWTWDGKLLQTLTGHQAPVWKVAISKANELIVSGSEDSTAKLWNSQGVLLTTLIGHKKPIRRVAINPQGTVIATTSSDNTVKLWNNHGVLLNTLADHRDEVWGVAFSPDGSMVATAGNDQVIKLWRLDGTLLTTFKGHNDWINNIVFSPDGNLIVSVGQDKTIRLWKWQTPLLKSFSGQGTVVVGVAFSKSGQMIASAHEDGSIELWNYQGRLIKRLQNPGAIVWGVAFSPDGKLIASANSDATVKLWNTKGALLKTMKGHYAEVWGVAFSPDGSTIASGSMDSTVKLWNVNDGRLLKTLTGHMSRVRGVAFSPDGILASASEDNTVKLWNINNGQLINTLKGHQSSVWDVTFSPDGKMIASGSEDNTIKLWNPVNGLLLRTLNGHTGSIWSVAFSPDNQLIASASADKTVKLWKANDGSNITTLARHSDKVNSVAFSPNGQAIASVSSDTNIIVWNLQQILTLDPLVYGCNWLNDYLQTNIEVQKNDRIHLCP